jgi:hypothetical protein
MVFNLMKLPRRFPHFNFIISYFRKEASTRKTAGKQTKH